MKKKIEKAVIRKLNDNTYSNKDDHIVSLSLQYERTIGGTRPYRDSYYEFIKALMELLEVETKQEIEGKSIMICSDWRDKILAMGNQEGIKWIESDPKVIKSGDKEIIQFNVVNGDIIEYLEEKERNEELDR